MKNIENIIKYMYENHESNARDISDNIEMLQLLLEDVYDAITADLNVFYKERKIQEAEKIQPYLTEIIDVQKQIEDIMNLFAENNKYEEDMDDEIDEEETLKKEKVDYTLYEENRDKPHLITENFKHKKICAFMLEGKKYTVKNWQDALVTLCEILSERDAGKFEKFIDMDEFCGRKVKYFGKVYVANRNCLIDGTDIYVWINLSANYIRTVMRKVLKQFKINTNSFYIFLRADYTALHKDNVEKDVVVSDNLNEEKIGKYVRNKMHELEQKKYDFDVDVLAALLDKDKTKRLIGINLPFFKEYDKNLDINSQVKDSKGYGRYWKELYRFNGREFFITSQWFDYNRNGFEEWYNELK